MQGTSPLSLPISLLWDTPTQSAQGTIQDMEVLSPYPLKTCLDEAESRDGEDTAPLEGTSGPRKASPRAAFSPDSKEKAPFNSCPQHVVRALRPGAYPFLWEHSPFLSKEDGWRHSPRPEPAAGPRCGGWGYPESWAAGASRPHASNVRLPCEVHIVRIQDPEATHSASLMGNP